MTYGYSLACALEREPTHHAREPGAGAPPSLSFPASLPAPLSVEFRRRRAADWRAVGVHVCGAEKLRHLVGVRVGVRVGVGVGVRVSVSVRVRVRVSVRVRVRVRVRAAPPGPFARWTAAVLRNIAAGKM